MATASPAYDSPESTIIAALRNGQQTDDHVCYMLELAGFDVDSGDKAIEDMVRCGELFESHKTYPEFGRVNFLTNTQAASCFGRPRA